MSDDLMLCILLIALSAVILIVAICFRNKVKIVCKWFTVKLTPKKPLATNVDVATGAHISNTTVQGDMVGIKGARVPAVHPDNNTRIRVLKDAHISDSKICGDIAAIKDTAPSKQDET